ncbi:MAG: UDP-glucose 4-epimerase GalE [Desulfovibrio desulfuricans]|jgi:UDP-glucose 4-epimerase|nr:UDP-glucose 4-epimerase GalE [Desulfovibrio desulfuricans]
MAILVCGGAGYIGSHNVRALLARGETPVVLDNFLTGHRAAVPAGVRLYEGDMRDPALLDAVFSGQRIDAVLHFAASSLVGESMEQPLKYFQNNIGGMMALLDAMVRHGADKIVFSSTASVYGEPESVPISEDAPLHPTNPYGESKLAMERMMRWVGQAHGVRSVILRYFNVAGAWPDGSIGEDHRPETHLIPIILQVPLGRRPHVTIFGGDYPTPDGSCIRDYLDVMDLADAHVRALDYLRGGGADAVCNLGNGAGFSVRQMVEAARRVTGHNLPVIVGPRRAGDPARLVASAARAGEVLGWKARAGIDEIIASAWRWHRTHPEGYGG